MAKDTETGRLKLAKVGEDLAAQYLERSGIEIVARNARTRWGEIDLVGRQGATWVFVEVKTRRSLRFGLGAEAVNYHKQQKILRMAQIYLARIRQDDVPVRFDVVEITYRREGPPQVRYLANAFGA